jgi:hypothetical protein
MGRSRFAQEPVVPGRVFRQAVVGNRKGTPLRGIEMFDRDHRDKISQAEAADAVRLVSRSATGLCHVSLHG